MRDVAGGPLVPELRSRAPLPSQPLIPFGLPDHSSHTPSEGVPEPGGSGRRFPIRGVWGFWREGVAAGVPEPGGEGSLLVAGAGRDFAGSGPSRPSPADLPRSGGDRLQQADLGRCGP